MQTTEQHEDVAEVLEEVTPEQWQVIRAALEAEDALALKEALAPVHPEHRISPDGPAHVRRRRRRGEPAFVNAVPVAPRAQRGQVFGLVAAAAVGLELQVVRRDVAP